jgi:hypothetical protein
LKVRWDRQSKNKAWAVHLVSGNGNDKIGDTEMEGALQFSDSAAEVSFTKRMGGDVSGHFR